jgi:hypothetical protein
MYVKPPTIIYCYYSLYTHYIPIILIIIKPPTRVSLLTYPWYSHCTPMIAAQISSVGYLSMNHGSWKITHIGTTIIKEKWFSTILTDVHFSIFLEVTIYTYTCVYIYITHIYQSVCKCAAPWSRRHPNRRGELRVVHQLLLHSPWSPCEGHPNKVTPKVN